MGNVVSRKQCPECKDSSRDNLVVYDDESTYCFACGHSDKTSGDVKDTFNADNLKKFQYVDLTSRGITKKVAEHFSYGTAYFDGRLSGKTVNNQRVHAACYFDSKGKKAATKIRTADKQFKFIGDASDIGMFGQQLFTPSENVFITVTEGELDALSVAQVQGVRYPVVSLRNGAGLQSTKEIKQHLEYLNGFKHVVLCFDMDEVGRKAVEEIAGLFDIGKVKVANLPLKDANEMLVAGKGQALKDCLWNAKPWMVDGIEDFGDSTIEDIESIVNKGVSLPWSKVTEMIHGIKKKRIYTFVAREKAGKSTVTKQLAMHLIDQGLKVGILNVEEDAIEVRMSMLAMKEKVPMWKVLESLDCLGGAVAIQKKLLAFKNTGLYIYNHKGRIDPDNILKRMSYMVKGLGCDVILLDNLSISIAGDTSTINERKRIDQIMVEMVKLKENTGCTVINVCHLTKNRKTKDGLDDETVTRADVFGSGSIAKFSNALIGLERCGEMGLWIKVLASRDGGGNGYADKLEYNPETGCLEDCKDMAILFEGDNDV